MDAALPRAADQQPSAADIERLQDERSALVEQYVGARPTGSDGWTTGVGIAAGAIGAAAGLGGILLANRGKGAMYQGFNLMFGAPAAMGVGGAVGFFGAGRLAEVATRPSGADAQAQVAATRDGLATRIADLDRKLSEADGRRPQPLPEVDDTPALSAGRVGMHAAAGAGIGLFGTGAAMAGVESLIGRPIRGGGSILAVIAAPAVATGAISLLNQRDEAAGRQGSFARSTAIGAGVLGAASLAPALTGIPIVPRVLGGVAAGALVGSAMHALSVSSRD